MWVLKRRKKRARSAVWSIMERSFFISLGFMARGSVSGSSNLILRFKTDVEMISCSMRKWRKATTQPTLSFTVVIRIPRSC